MANEETSILKLFTIGASGVGKNTLFHLFNDNDSLTSIGMIFAKKIVQIDGKQIVVQIWDTAKQEKFRMITRVNVRLASGIFMIYDSTNRESFELVKSRLKDRKESFNDIVCSLISTKNDLYDQRQVTSDEGKNLAQQFGIPFYEALLGDKNIANEIIEQMVKLIVDNQHS